MSITFADLFSGIGGFHAVGHSFGWQGVYACDIDEKASKVYRSNWGISSFADLTNDASETKMAVPRHDVLFAGFPCQPFSKGGYQRGMDEARGTLFWNIARVLEVRKPKLVVLENVRNLYGPRHVHEWEVIIQTLRELGYAVSEIPLVTSPHRIPPEYGGRPQTRERIYINATYVPPRLRSRFELEVNPVSLKEIESEWTPDDWDLNAHVRLSNKLNKSETSNLGLSSDELKWINIWDDFLTSFLKKNPNNKLPGFPLWADVWLGTLEADQSMPTWKIEFIKKNRDFYSSNKNVIDNWLRRNPNFLGFPNSRRKLEWQARDAKSIWDCAIQLRPSGIRVKLPTYVPAVVAMTQTTVYGPLKRRLSVREVARLQGLPESFQFGSQHSKDSYKQLGNGISIGSAYQSVRHHVLRDQLLLKHTSPELLNSVLSASRSPILE
jgi:DNA (cytosine-5)-methyltransferase 1